MMNTLMPLCNTTNIPRSPAVRASKTYSRAPKTKETVAALAATYGSAVEKETMKKKANITPTRQKRKRLDIESEVQTLQAFFKDVDKLELQEELSTPRHSTPLKSSTPSTRAPWLTPEEKLRGRMMNEHAAHADGWITPQKQKQKRSVQHDDDADKENAPAYVLASTPTQTTTSITRDVFATPDKPVRKELFATPEQKPRRKMQKAEESSGQKTRECAQTTQDVPQDTQLRRSTRVRRTETDAVATKLRRVR